LELKKPHDKGFEVEGFRGKKKASLPPLEYSLSQGKAYGKSMARLLVLRNHVPTLKVKTR
jgi:hypothetical protein